MDCNRFTLPDGSFSAALKQRGSVGFATAVQHTLRRLELPLASLMQHGSRPLMQSVEAVIHAVRDKPHRIRVRISLFFESVDAGCACENDPTPMVEYHECADLMLSIEPASGRAWLEEVGEEAS